MDSHSKDIRRPIRDEKIRRERRLERRARYNLPPEQKINSDFNTKQITQANVNNDIPQPQSNDNEDEFYILQKILPQIFQAQKRFLDDVSLSICFHQNHTQIVESDTFLSSASNDGFNQERVMTDMISAFSDMQLCMSYLKKIGSQLQEELGVLRKYNNVYDPTAKDDCNNQKDNVCDRMLEKQTSLEMFQYLVRDGKQIIYRMRKLMSRFNSIDASSVR